MRFMAMHRSSPNDEAGIPPSPELMQGMGQLIQEGLQKGLFLGGEGLQAGGARARVRVASGNRSIMRGPYAGDNELVASITLIKARSMDDAIEWASRLAAAVGDSEIEIGPVNEPWDLGLAPRPADAPSRFLLLRKADRLSEAGGPPEALTASRVASLNAEMQKAGVLLASEILLPSSHAVRLRYVLGRRKAMIDGPFTESKELVAGFAILRFDTMPEAVEWTGRFAALFPEVEVDIRPLVEPSH